MNGRSLTYLIFANGGDSSDFNKWQMADFSLIWRFAQNSETCQKISIVLKDAGEKMSNTSVRAVYFIWILNEKRMSITLFMIVFLTLKYLCIFRCQN